MTEIAPKESMVMEARRNNKGFRRLDSMSDPDETWNYDQEVSLKQKPK